MHFEPTTAVPRQRFDEGKGFTVGYDLGPVGFWVRILGAVAASAIIASDLISSQPTTRFWSEAALWLTATVTAYTVVYVALAPRVLPRLNPWVMTALFYGPVLVLPYIGVLPNTFRLAVNLYIVASIGLVVIMRYGGNAVVAIPALISGRRHVVYCPWNAADIVDKATEDSHWSTDLQGATVKIVTGFVVFAVLLAGFLTAGPAEPVTWILTFLAAFATIGAWVAGRRLLRSAEAVK